MPNNNDLGKRAEELRNRYGFEGFVQLDDTGTPPSIQWDLAVEAAYRIRSLAGPKRIQVHPMGHGGASGWDAFEEYILKPRDGNKPVVELDYCSHPFEKEMYLEVGKKKESPTGEYRPVVTPAKDVRFRDAPLILVPDDWTTSGESLLGGPIWVAENRDALGAEIVYTFVFRNVINLANVCLSRPKAYKADFGKSNVKFMLTARDKKGMLKMRETFKYCKDKGFLPIMDPWGWEHLEALERQFPEDSPEV
jgi:hypothetical protein